MSEGKGSEDNPYRAPSSNVVGTTEVWSANAIKCAERYFRCWSNGVFVAAIILALGKFGLEFILYAWHGDSLDGNMVLAAILATIIFSIIYPVLNIATLKMLVYYYRRKFTLKQFIDKTQRELEKPYNSALSISIGATVAALFLFLITDLELLSHWEENGLVWPELTLKNSSLLSMLFTGPLIYFRFRSVAQKAKVWIERMVGDS